MQSHFAEEWALLRFGSDYYREVGNPEVIVPSTAPTGYFDLPIVADLDSPESGVEVWLSTDTSGLLSSCA
ncbi:MAG TPA: hypothetical protein VFM10_07170, partial [Terriglobales bacterium]|nr:hypothetical protein [Terriglobales bacterium]